MTIPLEAVVGELHIISGARQGVTRPTAALVAPRHAARGRSEDTLFILVELRGPEPLPYEAVIDRIETTYWRTPGSVTSALRAALTVTNDWLMDRNVQAEVADRVRAGISCAALRESDMFIAQAGPGAAYVAHHGRVERFPARDVTAQALGASRALDVRFSHAALNPGDVVLLCDSTTADQVTDEQVAGAIVYTGVEAALRTLEKLSGTGDLIALVIEGAAEAKTQAAIRAAVEQTQVSSPPLVQPVESIPSPLTIKPIKRPSAEQIVEADKSHWAQRMAERAASLSWLRRDKPQARPQPQPSVVESPEAITLQLAEQPQAQVEVEQRPGTEIETMSWAQRVRAAVARLNLRQRGRAIAGSVTVGLVVALRGVATVLQRTLPEDMAAGPRSRGVNSALMTLAMLIPLAVAVLVAASYTQQSALQQYESLLTSARSAVSKAADAPDPIERRKQWASALDQADEALKVFPDSTDARQVRDAAQQALDQIDNVLRVAPVLLHDFHSLGGQYRLAVQGLNVFVLDKTTQQVYQLVLNESGESVANKNERGELPVRAFKGSNVSGRMVGELIDLTWMPMSGARNRASLLIVDSGGLLDYEPAWEKDLRSVPLGQGPTPLGARAVAYFGGNLYLLDTTAGQIWRYKPQGDGYGTAPEGYFEKTLDLSSVMDWAIDGNIYLLQQDGNVRKYLGGKDKEFSVKGLNEPLKRPAALTVDPDAKKSSLYVADAGTPRIVQLSTEGAFMRELRATSDAFNALQDLIVDERAGRLFVISGGKLYTARLPVVP